MERARLKLALMMIAVASAGYWAQPPRVQASLVIVACCLVWVGVVVAAFRNDRAEDWCYRLSSFLGVALGTIEGLTGLLNVGGRPGLLPLALLHFLAFALALAGRYQKVSSKRKTFL